MKKKEKEGPCFANTIGKRILQIQQNDQSMADNHSKEGKIVLLLF